MKQLTDVLNRDFVRAIEDIGGEVYLVGGCVRDMILGKDPKDIDLIVRNVDAKTLETLLDKFGTVDLVGESFGVFKFNHQGEEFDIALPRSDRASKEFVVELNPTLENPAVFKILYGGPINENDKMP